MSLTQVDAQESRALVRELGWLDATMIVVGSMIGSGIFITSAESARLVGAPGWLLMAWILASIMTMSGALSCAELAAMMPRAGGQYVFLREAYSPVFGFLFGWSTFLVVQTGLIAAVAVAFARFLGILVPWVSAERELLPPLALGSSYALRFTSQQLVAITVITTLTIANTRGLRLGKLIQNVFTFSKTAALFGLIVVGLGLGISRQSAAWTSSWWDPWANGWSPAQIRPDWTLPGGVALVLLLGRAMIGPLFSETAWNTVTFTGGETRDPGRTLPRALMLGCGSVIVLYLLANLTYVLVLPFDQIQHAHNDLVGTAAMEAVLGAPGNIVMALAILISTFGCINGVVLSGARVYYAMARDGLFFARAGTTNSRHVPAAALLAQGLWASLLVLPVTVTTEPVSRTVRYGNLYSQLLEYIIPVDLSFYVLMVGAVVVFRRKAPDWPRPYRTIAYPLPIVIFVGLGILLVADFIAFAPGTSGVGALIVLAGLPVYAVWSRLPGSARRLASESSPSNPPS
jgi:APA family basic amino acid/polyamine antiporter